MTVKFLASILCRAIGRFYDARLILSSPILYRRPFFNRFTYSNMADNASKEKEHVHGDRKFYDILSEYAKNKSKETFKTKEKPDCGKLIEYVAKNIVGKDYGFLGPYGRRKVVYCDYTASGRSLQFIEDYIQNEVLPAYGNTHTTTTITSLQTTLFRHEARDIIRNAVNASEHDAVIFTGNGCTSAIHKLINAMKLDKKPIVFVGPYEHHSNLLPWREISENVIRIKERDDGLVDLIDLENHLQVYENSNEILIGCFSSASNVTGILCNDDQISILLHKYNALSIWDYACAAPYIKIDMNPVISGPDQSLVYKDAIVISPHKFVGGVGTPGILIAKKSLFQNPIPSNGGGGSVFFVSRKKHRYLKETEMREEGGTPAIVESIRAGLVFQLKENISSQVIMEKEEKLTKLALDSWEKIPEIILLGSKTVPRLAIFSFLIRNEKTKLFLHHGFVCAVLNDLFGIQTRGGCACAGPYSLDLLGIDEKMAEEFENVLLEDNRLDRIHLRRYHEYSSNEILRPGFIRLNFPFFMTEEQAKFVIEAVKMVAENGWKLLPQYIFNPETGEWRHQNHQVFKERKWLGSISYLDGEMNYNRQVENDSTPLPDNEQACLEEARLIFDKASKVPRRINLPEQHLMFSDLAVKLKWFLLPSEAHKIMSSNDDISTTPPPFTPKIYDSITPKSEIKDEISISIEQTPKPDKISNSNRSRWILPPKNLIKPTVQAINEFDMIKNDDRILVCLSGGKDSLSLLHVLHQYQFLARSKGINFELGAVTVDPQSSAYDPSLLKPYLKSLSVCYFYEEQGILDHASTIPELGSICSFCSRLKRGRLYACARREGYNVLAFGQHLDDLSETFLMSAFHNGRLRTMKAHYTVKEGDLRVIRPFVYVREKNTRSFAEKAKLPVIPENCPACFEAPKERHRTKQLLAQQEILFPKLFWSLRSTLQPLMAIDRCGVEGETLIRQSLKNLKHEE